VAATAVIRQGDVSRLNQQTRGADVNWIDYDQLTPLDAARRSGAEVLARWLLEHGARSANDLQ
jgi:hypothetical protein